jgi:hypothetical protein
MTNNIKYSIEKQDGNILVRSTVKSFNLDHVTDKDITSYYRNVSNQALFDTGLLPLNGTGTLAIRSAGRHTQIAFQHAPALAYINWGANEGDPKAKAYLLAQPYRIWIADLLDGNLYGARMFYSPYPISHPDQPLYHVNLPNTNCKGYRGNGVGWQCLYHNEDWTNLSFNDKVNKLIQRCSGIEAYNDANMSETDGPRFYRDHNKPEHLWNPTLWQDKSQEEGFDWTLNEDLWIPILVKDMDNQEKHYDDGQPLTFAMALLGNYNSYYNDTQHPKLVNAFARSDISIPVSQVFDIFAQAHNSAKTEPQKMDQFDAASSNKVKISETFIQPSLFNQEDNNFTCPSCEELYDLDDEEKFSAPDGAYWCQGCFQEYWIYCENTEEYLHSNDDNCVYIESSGIWIDSTHAKTENCPSCDCLHWIPSGNTSKSYPFYTIDLPGDELVTLDFCTECFSNTVAKQLELEPTSILGGNPFYGGYVTSCMGCETELIKDVPQLAHYSVPVKNVILDTANNVDLIFTQDEVPYENWLIHQSYLCLSCAKNYSYCSGGHWSSHPQAAIIPWVSKPFDNKIDNTEVLLKVNEICIKCFDKEYDDTDSLSIPFKSKKMLSQAIAAIQYKIAPTFSTGFQLFNLDGTEYSTEPF